MWRIQQITCQYPVASFIILTLIISLVSFSLMLTIPGAQSPESRIGLPVWLVAIWSPNIAAIMIWACEKSIVKNIQLAFSTPKLTSWSIIILIPLLIGAILLASASIKGVTIEWTNFKASYILPLLLINLLMGPLGEELGWRGFLYPHLKENYGWLKSAALVGLIWAFWHAPLWLIESPQSKIPFWAFAVNVICLSILMSILYEHSNGSLIPIILFHLIFNLSLSVIDILGSHAPGEYVITSLYIYIPTTLLLMGLQEFHNT